MIDISVYKKNIINPILELYNNENIDLEDLIERLGGKLEVNTEKLNQVGSESMLERLDDDKYKFVIYIKRDSYMQRNRFSIAHELGHLFIHMKYKIDEDVFKKATPKHRDNIVYNSLYREMENEANEFAAELLMPEDRFRKYFKKIKKKFDDEVQLINKLAEEFNVSYEAAFYRTRFLGLLSW